MIMVCLHTHIFSTLIINDIMMLNYLEQLFVWPYSKFLDNLNGSQFLLSYNIMILLCLDTHTNDITLIKNDIMIINDLKTTFCVGFLSVTLLKVP